MIDQHMIHEAIQSHGVRFIDLWFTDLLGIVKGVTIPVDRLDAALVDGVPFDGSSIDGFARVAESDMILLPDMETFRVLPWTDPAVPTARFICNAHNTQGEPFLGDPRNVLKRVLAEAESMGFRFKTGMELEFFLFKRDADGKPIVDEPIDETSYFDMSLESSHKLRRDMMLALDALGMGQMSSHSEIARGQHEIELPFDDALRSADNMLTARVALRSVAQNAGYHCTFMPRPCGDLPGSGLHTHQSLHDLESGTNVFADAHHEYGLSDVARQFLAGQLFHARAMTAVLAPLVNSYKRLGKSFEAPVYVSWAHVNRAALVRVPSINGNAGDKTRLELRCPDPSSNPYLATAVMLKAGLNGIRCDMSLVNPLEETLLSQTRSRMRQTETLPSTLGEALDVLRDDDVILDALGPYAGDRFIEAKQQEFDDYNRFVSQWELDRYLTRY